MIITRKIQVYVYDKDATEKKEYIHTLYTWRDYVRKAANAIVAHKFVQQNIRDFVYIKDEIKEKFYVKDIINDGKGMSEELLNRVLSPFTTSRTTRKVGLGISLLAQNARLSGGNVDPDLFSRIIAA